MEAVRRWYEPRDAEAFGPRGQAVLRGAMEELRFLLNRGYELKSASTFICNHYLLSERQRMALARVVSADAALEARLLEEVNALGIGPQGFGGKTTCLGLAIEQAPTHVAGLPVAVNVSCHVTRRATARL